MAEISPSGKSDGSSFYKAQYTVSPQFRKFWEKGFKGTSLTDKEIHQLTDGFFQNFTNQMNTVMNNALKEMKKLERERKRAEGE